jgi:ribokinase
MDAKKIVVVGSTNMDMVVKTSHIPAHGETVLGGAFFMNPGGKGANQAVAVARLGGNVLFVSKIGNDVFGKQAMQGFAAEGIDTSCVFSDSELPSGVALITVDAAGENSIVVASGANGNLLAADIEAALGEISTAGVVLLQLEIPLATVEYVAGYAASNRVRVILNPAPAAVLPSALFSHLDVITPNETEASMISGIEVLDLETARQAATRIQELGVRNVVITMGAAGALVLEGTVFTHVPARKVQPVDTTAAGDVFNGALAVALAEGLSLPDAVRFASEAAAVSVTRLGAQSSIPYRSELVDR